MNINTFHPDLEAIEFHKREIFQKLKDGQWTYDYVLSLSENTGDKNKDRAIKSAKIWCESQVAMQHLGFDSWNELNSSPENFRLIKRIEFSQNSKDYPYPLKPMVGDEITIAFLDFETTGLSHNHDKVIELGLVILKYSPSLKDITCIDKVISKYNDPEMPISAEITEITGICDDDVKGKSIDLTQLTSWLKNEDTYIIAHNAKFDRPFFHKLMGKDNYRWGCSASQINWKKFKNHRIESAKLEYILLKLGYFYEGHRASIDCLAMVQMFVKLPEALDELLENINQDSYYIEATRAPFEVKDELKGLNFRWQADKKVWSKVVSHDEREAIMQSLDNLADYNHSQAHVTTLSARERFKLTN